MKYPQKKNLFANLLPWAFVSQYGEGVVVHKSGMMQKTFMYRGPDLESANPVYFNNICLYLNDIVKRLGTGWAIQAEEKRYCTTEYPGTNFVNTAAYLVDREREENFKKFGKHHESLYYMTVIYDPPSAAENWIKRLFIKGDDSTGYEALEKEGVETLMGETEDIMQILSREMQVYTLDNTQTLEYLHSSISLEEHPMNFSFSRMTPFFLDSVLPDQSLKVSQVMKLGDYYIPILGIKNWPLESYPAILYDLNATDIEYRWVNRFICCDREKAVRRVEKTGEKWRGAADTWRQAVAKILFKADDGHKKQSALTKSDQTDEIENNLENEIFSLGTFTTDLMVWDTDYKEAEKKIKTLKGLIQSNGFTCVEEKANPLECFQSMMPGNVLPNIRRTDITSLNFAHVLPLSAVWSGNKTNDFAKKITGVGVPHLVCSTNYSSPFYFNQTPAGSDVGNLAILGPVGAGKSTLLQLLEVQFLKYPKTRVLILDIGKSARQLTMAVGGRYYEPGTSAVAFQPLGDIYTYADQLWAEGWIQGLLLLQNIQITTEISGLVHEAVKLLSTMEKRQRTMTTLQQIINRQEIKDALQQYILGGSFGQIFDADSTTIDMYFWVMIEMDALMQLGDACVSPALEYIFHLFEKYFDGTYTELIIDEAAQLFKNKLFAHRFQKWMKTLRKKNVQVVIATQEVADIVDSPLCSTITQECLTKIYLADKEATTPVLKKTYAELGLSDAEIEGLARAIMKKDYFCKSPDGTRKFQLDLGELTLAFTGRQDHAFLDSLEQRHEGEPGYAYWQEILDAKKIDWKKYMEDEQ